MKKTIQLRLALRHEGDWWNAYVAPPNTMKGSLQIGSILIRPCATDPDLKQRFMSLMQDVLGMAVEDITGTEIEEWHEHPAPEYERRSAPPFRPLMTEIKSGDEPTDAELTNVDRTLMGPHLINLLEQAGLTYRERQVISWALRKAPRPTAS
jgi:hypothetical protein